MELLVQRRSVLYNWTNIATLRWTGIWREEASILGRKNSDAGLLVGRTEGLSTGIITDAGSLEGQVLSSYIHNMRTRPHTQSLLSYAELIICCQDVHLHYITPHMPNLSSYDLSPHRTSHSAPSQLCTKNGSSVSPASLLLSQLLNEAFSTPPDSRLLPLQLGTLKLILALIHWWVCLLQLDLSA